jgi:uncharacterized protein
MPRLAIAHRALLAALLVLFLVTETAAAPACGGHDLIAAMQRDAPQAYAKLQSEAATIPNGQGLLWRVEKTGVAPSHLFGTIHITDERVTTLPPPVREALEAAGTVAVESVEALDRSAMQKNLESYKPLMFFEDGRSLAQHLSADRRAALDKALKTLGGKIDALGAAKPWVVATTLAAPACETARQAELPVVDKIVAEQAQESGIPLVSLESVKEQLSAFDSIPLDLQAEYLIASVRLFPRLEDLFATMTELYVQRRIATIEALSRVLSEQVGISETGYDAFNVSLVDRRNAVILTRAIPLIDKGNAFIAVGALHLIDGTGLVALLRDKGYTVTRVY